MCIFLKIYLRVYVVCVCLYVYVLLCVYVCVCECLCVHVQVYMCSEVREHLSLLLSFYFSWQSLSLNLDLTDWLYLLASKLWGSPVFSTALGLQMRSIAPGYHIGAGNPKSGHCVYLVPWLVLCTPDTTLPLGCPVGKPAVHSLG